MKKNSKLNQIGDLNKEKEKEQPVTQFLNEGLKKEQINQNTLDTLEKNPKQTNPNGFQNTEMPKKEKDQDNFPDAQMIVALAEKLGDKVLWKKLTLGGNKKVIALCFPNEFWTEELAMR